MSGFRVSKTLTLDVLERIVGLGPDARPKIDRFRHLMRHAKAFEGVTAGRGQRMGSTLTQLWQQVVGLKLISLDKTLGRVVELLTDQWSEGQVAIRDAANAHGRIEGTSFLLLGPLGHAEEHPSPIHWATGELRAVFVRPGEDLIGKAEQAGFNDFTLINVSKLYREMLSVVEATSEVETDVFALEHDAWIGRLKLAA